MERCESRVIEPEIMINAGAFVVLTAGAESKRHKRLGAEIRPGSESRANAQRIPWEHERSDWLSPKRERTGSGVARPVDQRPGAAGGTPETRGEQKKLESRR